MKPDGKVVLLGDMNVGKTSLLHRYMERRFQDTVSTVGGAFYLKQWGPHNFSVWDTAGEGGRGRRRRVCFFPAVGGEWVGGWLSLLRLRGRADRARDKRRCAALG